MDQTVAANPVAKSAVETALWDAWARTLEVGVSVLLGGRYRDQLPVTWAIGAAEPDAVVDEALEKIDSARHASIKLKMGALEPERDVARVEKIADALSGRTSIRVDLNGAWDEFTGMRYLSRLRDAGIALVEQPTPGWNLDAMQRITGAAEVPVMADESLTSEHDALALARRNAADVFSVKIGKSGGYLAARRIAAVASAAGIPCHGGTAIESPVGTLAAAQFLCSLPPVTYGSELFGPLLMTDGLFTEPLDYVDGSLRLPDGPGFGRDLDLERVRRYERR